ncbi:MULTISPECIES: serine protease [unclassified Streptomyces]|uniref:serine protease n=1 Tax=unclassified Streptomyces TaxID=2593676 RepID=UPI002DDB992A|nr:serine protease [Streptomyces sp. NBC_01761]WSC53276.1 serine protease [Streptomyces sp. NBC_01761]WSF84118.1 serine protease [Streptomyces sp. NBC_01744]
MGSGDRSTLVRICDPAGRPRGTGFVADDRGTVVTCHEAVDGLLRLVLHGTGDRSCRVEADAITAIPELDLALVRTGGLDVLGVEPLPIVLRDRIGAGTYVRIAAHGWREARVLGVAPVTYAATDRSYRVGAAMELALGTDGRDALRLRGAAVGGPVLDPDSGAVIAVVGTALRGEHPAAGFAVPLVGAGTDAPLGALLRRNATTVPGYGRDLNLAGALQLAAMSVGAAGGPGARPDPVERPDITAEFTAFTAAGERPEVVLGLVAEPGTGRTTELAALAARRARGCDPALTLWLRGADLLADDASVADAIARTLGQAGRIVTAAGAGGDMATATPERVARLAADSGRPLLVLLDGPEEMPPVLAHRLDRWTAGTVDWLRSSGARLVIACRPEHWETAGALCPPGALHRPARPARRLPAAVRLAGLTASQAERARERYAIPADALAPGHDRHPLTLRLLAEVRAALPGDVAGQPDTDDVFGAHLDLMCLRIAVRIAAASRPALKGTAVRRLAARVTGQVHEAARRCLGPGQGELDRAAFEEIFPWRTGWASAVLTEGLLIPAGAGYRFAHEELGDWVQGAHLDLDTALRSLVHRWHEDDPVGGASAAEARVPAQRSPRTSRRASTASERGQVQAADAASGAMPSREPHTLPVPHHRIGPVIQALLLLGRRQGAAALSHRLADLIEAMDRLSTRTDEPGTAARRQGTGIPTAAAGPDGGAARPGGAEDAGPLRDASWWAAHLLSQTLLRVPDAGRHVEVLRLLAGRIVRRSGTEGGTGEREGARDVPPGPGYHRHPLGAYAEFGPWFWLRLRLPEADRIDLLRRLVPADGPPRGDGWDGDRDGRRGRAVACRDEGGDIGGERFLDVVARRLVARPRIVQPLLCRWFTDERPLPAEDGVAMRPTVAAAAQALLYARRDLAVDDLTDALVATVHPRADELLVALAEDEPAALCRAVERWARDGGRRARRGAAASYGLVTAPHATAEADRALLRRSPLALLAHPADVDLHGAALTLLVRDPQTRDRYLPQALRVFVQGDPHLSAAELVVALPTHREPVIAAFREALTRPGDGAGEVLRSLAGIDAPALALHAAGLVRAYVDSHPEGGAHAAAYIDRRLEHGPVARALLLPLMSGLLRDRPAPAPVRGALARVLAAPGTPASGALRAELLEVLLEFEQGDHRDPVVLDALLCAAATGSARRAPVRTRALVHRTGMLLVRTPEGAARFDRKLVELARDVPGFAQLITGWLADAPQEWAAVVGPGARRTVDTLSTAMTMPMQAPGRGHGSLRPA